MPRYTPKLARLAVIGLSVGALLPATASAMPINDGQAPAQQSVGQTIVRGGDVVSGHGYHFTATPSNRLVVGGGDVVSSGGDDALGPAPLVQTFPRTQIPKTGVNGPPVFPTNTKPLPRPGASKSDGGIDTGVLIALGVGIVLALGAWLLVVATKPRTRKRQAA